ncbi:MAG: putative transporter, permease protein [Caproiciproducens sp.]|nr:putative transporter, permease protein [Caproiciproducens sp.]
MLGLIVKDLLCLKKSALKMVVILGLYIVIFYSANNIVFLCAMIIMISTMLILNTFAYDELSKWDYYALSLPVTKKQIILSKYLLTVLFDFIGILITLLLYLIKRQLNLEAALSICALAATALIMAAVLLPLLYKLGTQKARIWMIMIFLLPTAAIIVLGNLGFHLTAGMPSESTIGLLVWISLPVALLFYAGSYFLSYKIFVNKEI